MRYISINLNQIVDLFVNELILNKLNERQVASLNLLGERTCIN